MKITVLIVGVLAVCVLAPNLIWLANSTTRITNGGVNYLNSVTVYVDDKETKIGGLSSGESRFIFLPKSGDATYKVGYVNGASSESVCQEYVEGEMYHVETLLGGARGSECLVTLPLTSELLILKVM